LFLFSGHPEVGHPFPFNQTTIFAVGPTATLAQRHPMFGYVMGIHACYPVFEAKDVYPYYHLALVKPADVEDDQLSRDRAG
jgi:hypothetical protein